MASELGIETTYEDFGLSNLMDKVKSNSDLSYDILGLTNLLDRIEAAGKKINILNIDDIMDDSSIPESKIVKKYNDLEAYYYLYLDRATSILHLGVEDPGYRLALSAGSATPRFFINEQGFVGINIQDPLYRLHLLGTGYVTNQETPGLLGEDPFTIITGGPNTRGQIIRGTQYSSNYTSRWVAVGIRNGTGDCISYSDDGTNWNNVMGLTIFTNNGNGVCWGNNKFVAVGNAGIIAYSSDGASWTKVASSPFTTNGACIVWNGATFLAGGSGTNTYAYSNDGINWTGVPFSADNPFETGVTAIVWDGNKFIAAGSSTTLGGIMAYSYDHIHWTIVLSGIGSINTICTDGVGMYVAAGSNTNFFSTDGINWSSLPKIHTNGTNHVVWNGTFFIAGGNDLTQSLVMQISTDGFTWASLPCGTYLTFSEIPHCTAWDGTKFVTGGQTRGVSITGASWTRAGWGTISLVNSICSQMAPSIFPAMPGVLQTPTNQTANLSEWQDYLSANLAYVDYAGKGVFSNLSVTAFNVAGFIKTTALGVLSGGNTISMADIIDWDSTSQLKLAVCFDEDVVVNNEEIVYLV